jgi:DNA polymerase III epsilon subunit-like protein
MNLTKQDEYFIVVDVETAGPNPATFAMLSIGAVSLFEMHKNFYSELKPDKIAFEPKALSISGLSLERLAEEGMPPEMAMHQFADWVKETVPRQARPVFTAFNAPFDWMFVNDYFHRYLRHNPFGHNALDIKAYYMGCHRTTWAETSHREISRRYPDSHTLTHHALEDAFNEAELFRTLLAECETQNIKS